MSKKTSPKNTFGWARAEVLGALINSVFLVALCFTIFVEAIQRLTNVHEIEHIDSMIYVGVAGLVINVIGLLLFYEQGLGRVRDADIEIVVDTITDPDPQTQGNGSQTTLMVPFVVCLLAYLRNHTADLHKVFTKWQNK